MRTRLILLALAAIAALSALTAVPASAHPLEGRQSRPDLPNEQTFGTEHFLIHYTRGGDDGVGSDDANNNNVPDYVDAVAEALEHVWQVEINDFGWSPPPPDQGEGGDERLDIYLENIMEDGYAGYVDSEGGFLGDNPLSPEPERRATYTYMVLDNDYEETEDSGRAETPIQLMSATVAHEFNHMVQSGYDGFEPHLWLYESTATWMEDEVHDDVNDGVYYLPDVFDAPDTCLVAESGWYGNWLLMRLISERYGHETVRAVWEHSRVLDGFDSMDEALAPHGSSLEAITRDYGIAILLRAYEEGNLYPGLFLEGTATEGTFSPTSGVQSYGTDYIRLGGSGVASAQLVTTSSTLSLRTVAIRGAEADIFEAQNGTLTVDMSAYDEVFALVQNSERANDEDSCTDAEYTLELTAGGTTSASVEQWSAANYDLGGALPPTEEDYEPPTGAPFSGAGAEFTDSPTDLAVPFEPIIPTDIPAGYQFDFAYIMAEADLGASLDYYMPGGGESANYDYVDDNEHWITIIESPSPYDTLQQWLDDIEYESSGEFIEVGGIEVLIEDLSDSEGPWFSATFILEGLFIVVDGDNSREDVLAMVEALIKAAGVEEVEPEPEITLAPEFTPQATPRPGITPEMPPQSQLGSIAAAVICALCGALICIIGVVAAIAGVLLVQRRRTA